MYVYQSLVWLGKHVAQIRMLIKRRFCRDNATGTCMLSMQRHTSSLAQQIPCPTRQSISLRGVSTDCREARMKKVVETAERSRLNVETFAAMIFILSQLAAWTNQHPLKHQHKHKSWAHLTSHMQNTNAFSALLCVKNAPEIWRKKLTL